MKCIHCGVSLVHIPDTYVYKCPECKHYFNKDGKPW